MSGTILQIGIVDYNIPSQNLYATYNHRGGCSLGLAGNETNKSNVSEYRMRMSEKQSNNPIPVVDVIIQQDFEVLFARRKKEPFKGYLGFPVGFVNLGETAGRRDT